jgi:hypothetical protein
VSFSDAEIDAAIAALSDPGRLDDALSLVSRAAPGLQRVLGTALQEGGWFDTAHEAAVKEAISSEHEQDRIVAVHTLLAEETRLTMLVGVAVGFELARELGHAPSDAGPVDAGPAEAGPAEAGTAEAGTAEARPVEARSDTATDQEDQ